jgi:hypothetical protein
VRSKDFGETLGGVLALGAEFGLLLAYIKVPEAREVLNPILPKALLVTNTISGVYETLRRH